MAGDILVVANENIILAAVAMHTPIAAIFPRTCGNPVRPFMDNYGERKPGTTTLLELTLDHGFKPRKLSRHQTSEHHHGRIKEQWRHQVNVALPHRGSCAINTSTHASCATTLRDAESRARHRYLTAHPAWLRLFIVCLTRCETHMQCSGDIQHCMAGVAPVLLAEGRARTSDGMPQGMSTYKPTVASNSGQYKQVIGSSASATRSPLPSAPVSALQRCNRMMSVAPPEIACVAAGGPSLRLHLIQSR